MKGRVKFQGEGHNTSNKPTTKQTRKQTKTKQTKTKQTKTATKQTTNQDKQQTKTDMPKHCSRQPHFIPPFASTMNIEQSLLIQTNNVTRFLFGLKPVRPVRAALADKAV